MSKPVFEDLFRLSGRRNRKSYFLYGVLMIVITSVAWGIAAATESGTMMTVAGIVSLLVVISSWVVGAQRCRDFGWTGWAILITIVPVVGWIFPFVMLFLPGTQGPNRYGPDPIGAD